MNEEKLIDWAKIKQVLTTKEGLKRTAATLIPLAALYIIFLLIMDSFGITKEVVQVYFEGKALWFLIPMFIAIQLLASLTPLPDFPFLAAGVLFFPTWAAFILIICGMWLGSIVNFYIARRMGREYVHSNFPDVSKWLDRFTGRYGLEALIISRSFTFVSFDIVSYVAGISNIGILKFCYATAIGLVPIALNATLVGIALTSTLEQGGFSVYNLFKSVVIFALTAGLSLLMAWGARGYTSYLESRVSA